MKKFIKKCPLTFSIIIAFIAVNVCGGIAIYKNVIPFDISMTHPVVASVFEYVSDKNNNNEYIYDETPIDPLARYISRMKIAAAHSIHLYLMMKIMIIPKRIMDRTKSRIHRKM